MFVIAEPSARNSGFEDKPSFGPQGFTLEDSNTGRTRPVVVPGMTVLLTTTRWYASAPLIADPTSSAAFFTNVRLMDPSRLLGVPTVMNVTSASTTLSMSVVNWILLFLTADLSIEPRPGSCNGVSPFASFAIFSPSMSTPIIFIPLDARTAAVQSPTYPRPINETDSDPRFIGKVHTWAPILKYIGDVLG